MKNKNPANKNYCWEEVVVGFQGLTHLFFLSFDIIHGWLVPTRRYETEWKNRCRLDKKETGQNKISAAPAAGTTSVVHVGIEEKGG